MKLLHHLTTTLLLLSSSLAALIPLRPRSAPPPPTTPLTTTKYFHEPGTSPSLRHYDARFFPGHPVTASEKASTLQYLIRAYLTTFSSLHIETWIAHGTLLGWWWNQHILPWDWDLDVQVSGDTLHYLAMTYNMTMHNHTTLFPDGSSVTREYLLDINPHYAERTHGDGENVIDARFVDVRNGLFVDITGLSLLEPGGGQGIVGCKNGHRYDGKEIWPLSETRFEGVEAWVPAWFDAVLTREYSGKALTRTAFEGHIWRPSLKQWIPDPQSSLLSSTHYPYRSSPRVHSSSVALMPHIPSSIQSEPTPRTGFNNLWRIFGRA